MKRNFASQSKFNRFNNSILWRWSIANAAFFFVVVIFVAFVSYMIMSVSIVGSNKDGMTDTMDKITAQLSKQDQPLSLENFSESLKRVKITADDGESDEVLQASTTLGLMVSSRNMNFFVFTPKHRLIFSTSDMHIPFHKPTNDKVISSEYNGMPGYLNVEEVRSEKTGEIIGYLSGYYDLANFNRLSQRLLTAYFLMVLIALTVAVFFGYKLSYYFIRPLREIGDSMNKVAAHPEEDFEPLKIDVTKTDEITQIADFYNQMMGHVNYYVEQQRGFVSDVAHELRTPIAVIDGHIHLLQRWGKDDPKILDESVQVIISETANMNEMVENMLSLTRLEQNENLLQFRNKTTDPMAQVERVLPNFELLHPEFTVTTKSSVPADALMRMDEGHYVQALMILLDNAAKYSPGDQKVIEVELSEEGDFITTSVSDKGMGMSKEDANLVFERFFRADKARNHEIGGTGLGLSILASIVKQYGGGHVEVDSEINEGSKFTFRIPKAR